MSSKVLQFSRAPAFTPGWTNSELAELYRVQHALAQSGLSVDSDVGVSDEGDPWFVFCRPDGEVVVHITRFDGIYRLYSPALPQALVGPSFTALTVAFVSGLRTTVRDPSVTVHPAALFSVLIAAIFYSIDIYSSPAHAAWPNPAEAPNSERPHQDIMVLPPKHTLFHDLVAALKTFLDAPGGSPSALSSILSTVEAAALLAAAAVSALGFSGLSSLLENGAPLKVVVEGDKLFIVGDHDSTGGQAVDRANAHDAEETGRHGDLATAQASDATDTQSLPPDARVVEKAVVQAALAGEANVPATDQPTESQSSNGRDQSIGSSDDIRVLASQDEAAIALGSKAAVAGDGQTHSLIVAAGDADIDMSGGAGNFTITIVGDGNLRISGLAGSGNEQIVFGSGSSNELTLSFNADGPASAFLKLEGRDQLLLVSTQSDDRVVQLTLDSEGDASNRVTVADTAVADGQQLQLKVVGLQDLFLQESGAVFSNTSLDTSGLSGTLTLGLDLSNVFQSVDLSQVNAANFVVANSGNIALLHAAEGSHIQLASNLNVVDLTIANASSTNLGSLALNLDSSLTTAGPVSVNSLNLFFASELSINSAFAGTGSNIIESLTDSSLSALTITGDAALSINSINGLTLNDGQVLAIDAHALTGKLVLNLTDVGTDGLAAASLTVVGGAGMNVLTNLNSSVATNFVTGAGMNLITIGAGSLSDSIEGLKSTDIVTVNSANNRDVVVDARSLSTSEQISVDQQSGTTAAAETASNFVSSHAAQQAVMFSYQGNIYAFIDASGDHHFDATHDAIVKLVGAAASSDLSQVTFYSA